MKRQRKADDDDNDDEPCVTLLKSTPEFSLDVRLPQSDDSGTANEASSSDAATMKAEASPNGQNNESILNDFVKLHPMISSDVFNPQVLNQLDNFLERRPIQLRQIPVVSKTYEDGMLRPPRRDRGERPCVLGEQCLCKFIAKIRYGPKNPYGFVCTEFIQPEQRRKWLNGEKLPELPTKCLVCLRYFTSYLYLMARSDPHFKTQMSNYEYQTHETQCVEVQTSESWHDKHVFESPLPSHANSVGTSDGYRRDACLFTDDKALQMPGLRDDSTANLAFKPFVRFNSSNYDYQLNGGLQKIVQVNVGERESVHARQHLNGVPPAERVEQPVEEDVASA
jgi:hypothetical protein